MSTKHLLALVSWGMAVLAGGLAWGAAPAPLPAAMAELGGTIRPVVRYYDGGRIAHALALEPRDGATATAADGAQWDLAVDAHSVSDRPDALEYRFTWTLTKGSAKAVVVGLEFPFSGWSADNFVFIPAAVYDGNRFAIKAVGYPPYWYNKAEWKLDMPTTMTPNPTLGKGPGPGSILFNTGNASVPLLAFQAPAQQRGWMVLTTQASRFGNYGIGVEENADRSAATFSIMTPAANEAHADWKTGDTVAIACRLYAFGAPQRADLLGRFSAVRKDLNPHVRVEELPFSAAWKLLENLYQQHRWDERIGMYCMSEPGTGTTWNFIWQLGWCGGGQCTLPLIMQGEALARQRAIRNMDVVFTKSQATSGFFNTYGNGEQFASFGFGSAFKYHESLIRMQGDWLYMAQRQFQALESTGATVPLPWKSGLQKQADAFVRLWNKRGQFGQFVDVETGDLCIGGSTCGAIAPGGLALASQTFKAPEYLTVAQAAARKYYHDFVQLGYTTGGPGEILSAPDSESAFGLFESFLALYEVTGSAEWLHDASELLPICASWTVAYDYQFPPNSAMGRIQAHSCGAVWASVANKHGAPGICTWSGDSLLKYFRATRDRRALDLLTDIAHGITQYMSRAERKVGNMPPGGLCERVNLSDWEGRHNVGGNIFGSCSWVETAAMLTVTQVPGLYVQPDTGVFAACDNIQVEKISQSQGVLRLRLTNPTGFPADVKILVETASAALHPRAALTAKDMCMIHVEAGGNAEFDLSASAITAVTTPTTAATLPSTVPAPGTAAPPVSSPTGAAGPQGVPLAEVATVSEVQPYGPLGLDHSNQGNPLKIGNRTFARGLGTHAPSRIVYALAGHGARFEAWVGVDAEMAGYTQSSIVFQVLGDGKILFDSGVMRINTPAKPVRVDLTGVAELALVVTDAGDGNICDHADWADAVVFSDAALPRRPPPPRAVPLSATATLGAAQVSCAGKEMTVTTGVMERRWCWTGRGLVTVGLRNVQTGTELAVAPRRACDWNLPDLLDDKTQGVLLGNTVRVSDDDGFSSPHLEVVSTIRYETAHLEMQHVVWAIPGAPGLRTQLRWKALPGYVAKGKADDSKYYDCGGTRFAAGARNDLLPVDFSAPNSRRYFGIYNDPGNRLPQDKPMLEEKVITGFPLFQDEVMAWASGAAVQYGAPGAEYGIIAVKESPKTVNQSAYLTGAFFSSPAGIAMTGWGLSPQEILPDRFRDCWATWCIVYSGGNDGLQLALKKFDAARYPVNVQRDAFILSNTWGPANPGGEQFTAEDFVLKEIPAVAKLGIDVMQIDEGWQKNDAAGNEVKYKNGWTDIKAAADKAGVRLGLWTRAQTCRAEELCKILDVLGYVTWKCDFEHLSDRAGYEARFAKYRAVMKHSWGHTQFTLCPEYDDPRYGWFHAQEFGSLYFQNIQEGLPIHLTLVPYQVLRQHWYMAKYFPTNKLQVMLQNPQRTRRDVSDAFAHSHGYCFAMGLPFVPQFFQSAQYLDEAGRKELTELIAVYKKARPDIFTSTTYPIGEEPTNASWTGFQMVSTTRENGGHLLLFRELHDQRPTAKVQLKFLAGKTLVLTNLLTGESNQATVDVAGQVELAIAKPADYRFLRYEVKK